MSDPSGDHCTSVTVRPGAPAPVGSGTGWGARRPLASAIMSRWAPCAREGPQGLAHAGYASFVPSGDHENSRTCAAIRVSSASVARRDEEHVVGGTWTKVRARGGRGRTQSGCRRATSDRRRRSGRRPSRPPFRSRPSLRALAGRTPSAERAASSRRATTRRRRRGDAAARRAAGRSRTGTATVSRRVGGVRRCHSRRTRAPLATRPSEDSRPRAASPTPRPVRFPPERCLGASRGQHAYRGSRRGRPPDYLRRRRARSPRLFDQSLDEGLDLLALALIGPARGGRGGAVTAHCQPPFTIELVLLAMLNVKVEQSRPTTDLYEQVAAEIRRAIADGEAKPGERLPPAQRPRGRPRRQHEHRPALAAAAPRRGPARVPPRPRHLGCRDTRTRRGRPERSGARRVRPPPRIPPPTSSSNHQRRRLTAGARRARDTHRTPARPRVLPPTTELSLSPNPRSRRR